MRKLRSIEVTAPALVAVLKKEHQNEIRNAGYTKRFIPYWKRWGEDSYLPPNIKTPLIFGFSVGLTIY
jgi:hypothetical protein